MPNAIGKHRDRRRATLNAIKALWDLADKQDSEPVDPILIKYMGMEGKKVKMRARAAFARTQGALRGAFLVDIGNTRVSPQRDGRFKAVTNYRLVFQTRKRRKK
jgi:hypothetical protein